MLTDKIYVQGYSFKAFVINLKILPGIFLLCQIKAKFIFILIMVIGLPW